MTQPEVFLAGDVLVLHRARACSSVSGMLRTSGFILRNDR
jgi:hypothetical protein